MLRPMSDGVPQALEIRLNGEPRTLETDCTVALLVESMGLADRRIAVAVNREVIPRSQFSKRALAEGDRVEILKAVGGGI